MQTLLQKSFGWDCTPPPPPHTHTHTTLPPLTPVSSLYVRKTITPHAHYERSCSPCQSSVDYYGNTKITQPCSKTVGQTTERWRWTGGCRDWNCSWPREADGTRNPDWSVSAVPPDPPPWPRPLYRRCGWVKAWCARHLGEDDNDDNGIFWCSLPITACTKQIISARTRTHALRRAHTCWRARA